VQQPVGKRRLPVVNVGDDAEIAYVCGVHSLNRSIVGSSNQEPINGLTVQRFNESERDRITAIRLKKRKFDS
jgi:hypothetical protein